MVLTLERPYNAFFGLSVAQCHKVKENYEARYLQKPLARAFLVMLNAVKHLVGMSVPIKY